LDICAGRNAGISTGIFGAGTAVWFFVVFGEKKLQWAKLNRRMGALQRIHLTGIANEIRGDLQVVTFG
jgi:hypothetical protein